LDFVAVLKESATNASVRNSLNESLPLLVEPVGDLFVDGVVEGKPAHLTNEEGFASSARQVEPSRPSSASRPQVLEVSSSVSGVGSKDVNIEGLAEIGVGVRKIDNS